MINNLEIIKPDRNINDLLDRGFIHLEAKDWDKANQLFEDALKINPRLSDAYLGKCMADLRIANKDSIKEHTSVLKNKNFNLALKFADKNEKPILESVAEQLQKTTAKKKKAFSIITIVFSIMVALTLLITFVGIPIVKVHVYNCGIRDVENHRYTEAETKFGYLKEYKDSEKYLNYLHGMVAFDNKDIKAYDYFSKCRGFKDTEEIINNCDWLKKLDFLQGNWHTKTFTLEERKKEAIDSGEFWVIGERFFSKDISYEEALSRSKSSHIAKGEVLSWGSDFCVLIEFKGTTVTERRSDSSLEYCHELKTVDEIQEIITINDDGSIVLPYTGVEGYSANFTFSR